MKVCSEWPWLTLVTIVDGLGPKLDHFGTPQKVLHFPSEGPQGARFRKQGPHNQKKVAPEPARLARWKQIWSTSVPRSNLKT